jgi:ankyrin repeat protein
MNKSSRPTIQYETFVALERLLSEAKTTPESILSLLIEKPSVLDIEIKHLQQQTNVLKWAIENESLDIIQWVVKHAPNKLAAAIPDVSRLFYGNMNAISYAACLNKPHIVELMIDKTVLPDCLWHEETDLLDTHADIMCWAIKNQHFSIYQQLIKKGYNKRKPSSSAVWSSAEFSFIIEWAARYSPEIFFDLINQQRYLLENTETYFILAAAGGHVEVANYIEHHAFLNPHLAIYLKEKNTPTTALNEAVKHQKLSFIKWFLKKHGIKYALSQQILLSAISTDNPNILESLLIEPRDDSILWSEIFSEIFKNNHISMFKYLTLKGVFSEVPDVSDWLIYLYHHDYFRLFKLALKNAKRPLSIQENNALDKIIELSALEKKPHFLGLLLKNKISFKKLTPNAWFQDIKKLWEAINPKEIHTLLERTQDLPNKELLILLCLQKGSSFDIKHLASSSMETLIEGLFLATEASHENLMMFQNILALIHEKEKKALKAIQLAIKKETLKLLNELKGSQNQNDIEDLFELNQLKAYQQKLKAFDINQNNDNGDTLLMLAAEHGHLKLIHYLLKKGADISKRNSEHETALTLAAENKHANIVSLLANACLK